MTRKNSFIRLALSAIIALTICDDISAQSGIYACGHIRRQRNEAITNLRNSGYTTAILFNVNVEEDGSLTTDFSWDSQTAAEAGGIICRDGKYIFYQYQPHYIDDVKSLLSQPTSINRLEICIGGWGNASYGKIKDLIKCDGTGEETMLYKNFKALKEAIPEIVAINNDQEQDYDVATATAFHRMLAEIGYKTTVAPYTNIFYWKKLVANLNEKPGTCDIVYLQTYGGGADNDPAKWQVFGDVPMHIGFDCEASDDINQMQQKFSDWHTNCNVAGGFLWNYNSEARNLNQWATAINRIFKTKSTDEPVAIFYQDVDFGGYAVELPVGEFTQAELALYGLRAKDLTSFKVNDGYKVTLYEGPTFDGLSNSWEKPATYVGSDWNDKACSIKIKATTGSIANAISNDAAKALSALFDQDSDSVIVKGAEGHLISLYNAAGLQMAQSEPPTAGSATINLSGFPKGVYIVSANGQSVKVAKH